MVAGASDIHGAVRRTGTFDVVDVSRIRHDDEKKVRHRDEKSADLQLEQSASVINFENRQAAYQQPPP
jgi:hypothetical protein